MRTSQPIVSENPAEILGISGSYSGLLRTSTQDFQEAEEVENRTHRTGKSENPASPPSPTSQSSRSLTGTRAQGPSGPSVGGAHLDAAPGRKSRRQGRSPKGSLPCLAASVPFLFI